MRTPRSAIWPLIRQFYDEARSFRITGESGQAEYIRYSNANLVGQAIPPAYPGQETEPGYVQARRKPVFDIVIKPQKRSPYSKLSQNELAKELYQMGFFNPELAEQSLTAIDMMDFDGKQKVKDKVQQGQTLVHQLAAMQQQVAQLGAVVYQLTGRDVVGLQAGGQTAAAPSGGGSTPGQGQAQHRAQGLVQGHGRGAGPQQAQRERPALAGARHMHGGQAVGHGGHRRQTGPEGGDAVGEKVGILSLPRMDEGLAQAADAAE